MKNETIEINDISETDTVNEADRELRDEELDLVSGGVACTCTFNGKDDTDA